MNLKKSAEGIHNFVRALDSTPGAWTLINGEEVRLFGSSLLLKSEIKLEFNESVDVNGNEGFIHDCGLLIKSSEEGDKYYVNIERLKIGNKMLPANKFGKESDDELSNIELTDEEKSYLPVIKTIWQGILNIDINDDTDFFSSGAGSMDVVRLVEEVKDNIGIALQNTDVFMAPSFKQFTVAVALAGRGASASKNLKYDAVNIHVNNIDIKFPRQLFINGEFVNGEGKPLDTINPHDETVICSVEHGSANDVDKAVKAAKNAFEDGEWSKISARERGALLFKLVLKKF